MKNDVITAIDGVRVGDDGTVPLRAGERVKLDYMITSKVAGAKTSLSVLRGGVPLVIERPLSPLVPPLPRWHGFDCEPEWVVLGGLLFAPLTAPLVEAAAEGGLPSFVHDVLRSEVSGASRFGFRHNPSREAVVLLDVLGGGDVNHGYEPEGWRILQSFNGAEVGSLVGLYAAWQAAARNASVRFLEFGFGGERSSSLLILEQAAVRDSEALLLRLHGIPSVASPGVIARSTEAAASAAATVVAASQRLREARRGRRSADGGGRHPRRGRRSEQQQQQRQQQQQSSSSSSSERAARPRAAYLREYRDGRQRRRRRRWRERAPQATRRRRRRRRWGARASSDLAEPRPSHRHRPPTGPF